ncbi:MAG: glycosyltransferase involved in cell wall biosynthesis [Pirellulaceae bacterium]
MKILLCHNYYRQLGGEDLSFEDEAWLLESRGHNVLRYTVHNDEIPNQSKLEVAKKTLWNNTVYREVKQLIQKERPDVMHCTNTFPLLSPAIYQAARDEGVAVVQALRNYRLMCPNAVMTRGDGPCEECLGKLFAWPAILHGCYRNSRMASSVVATMLAYHRLKGTWKNNIDLFYTLTEFTRQKYIEGGFPGDRILVKPNFVRDTTIQGTGSGNYAVYVGRLSHEKGIGTLLDAWKNSDFDLKLKFVGTGPMSDAVEKQAENDSRIEWLGQQTSDQVRQFIADATCLIFPSTWYETFGRTIIEAYSVGTPVVASRLGAMKENVFHGTTGMHFEAGDSDDLSAKVAAIIDHKDRAGMRRAARACYEEKYTPEINYDMLINVYETSIQNAGIHRPKTQRRQSAASIGDDK